MKNEIIKSYKGFDKDMKCLDFQYKEGETYTTDKAEACECGFHACENPIDMFGYYYPANSIFHEVEQSGELSKHDDDSKVASTVIKIGVRLNIKDIIRLTFDYVKSKTTNKKQGEDYAALNGGNRSALNGGNWSALSVGKYSVAYGQKDAKVKGLMHSVLALAEYDDNYAIVKVHVKAVDGKRIKEDTWYQLINKKFTEVK